MNKFENFLWVALIPLGMGFLMGSFLFDYLADSQSAEEMGQMICDEQYGQDQSEYYRYDDDNKIVVCEQKPLEQTEIFEGGRTKLIGTNPILEPGKIKGTIKESWGWDEYGSLVNSTVCIVDTDLCF